MHTQDLFSSTSLTPLPTVPMTIDAYNQFITWAEFPATPKPRKVPVNPTTLTPVDPHLSVNWMSRADAEAHCARDNRLRVGFVLTDADPFFLIDLDGCLTPTGWDQESTAVFQMFAGAAAEVSISGNGLHIMGRCDQQLLRDRAHKFGSPLRPKPTWIEFYTTKRFVALGYGFQGDFNLDWTGVLAPWIPIKEAGGEVDLPAGPAPGYTGPTDDNELIERMKNSGPSANAGFGKLPHPKYLWEGDAAVLCQFYPSSTGDVYDRSAADAALMWHFSYWTGKDAARMDKLFRRSGLMRPKYEDRSDYRVSTIRNAIASNPGIYDKKPGTEGIPGQIEFEDDMVKLFDGLTYVKNHHSIYNEKNGEFYKPDQFDAMFGGHDFMLDYAGKQTSMTKSAFTAFTKTKVCKFAKMDGTCFRPALEPGAIITEDGRLLINTYRAPEPKRIKGDATRFLNHLAKLYPNERDQRIILAWMAMVIQRPGKKIGWSIVLQTVEGAGKGVIEVILRHAVSNRYFHTTNARDIDNKFNAQLEDKRVVLIDEVMLEKRRDLLEVMKPVITNPRIEIQPKGIDKREIDSVVNLIFFTNWKSGVPIKADGRRYTVLYSALQHEKDVIEVEKMDDRYFDDLFTWLEGDGAAIVFDFLMNYLVTGSEFDVKRAPKSSTHDEAIIESDGDLEAMIREAIDENHPGFKGGYVSAWAVNQKAKLAGIRIGARTLGIAVEQMGFRKIGQAPNYIFEEGKTRPIIYCKDRKTGDWFEEYKRAQGYDREKPALPDFLTVIKG